MQTNNSKISRKGLNIDDKINFAYITSCRELALDEKIGRIVWDQISFTKYGYREGNLENLARRLAYGNDEFSKIFNLVAVIVDDDDEQYHRAWNQADIWPRKLPIPISHNGTVASRTLEEMTIRIPSQPWKSLRQTTSETKEEFKNRKVQSKTEYEKSIKGILMSRGVDLVVSDSYMTIIGPTLLNAYEGRIINIHPAITDVNNPHRLPGPTPTRDAYTRAVYGYIIIDDKHSVDIPDGPRIKVKYEGKIRDAVTVPKSNITGVTVHVINEEVDNGPVIEYDTYSFKVEGITPEAIRDMNYVIKRSLLPRAMMNYTERPNVRDLIVKRRGFDITYLPQIQIRD